MKQPIEKRTAEGIVDHVALAFTTWGVGYIPGAPGTYGSLIAVVIYVGITWIESAAGISLLNSGFTSDQITAGMWAFNSVLLTVFCIVGIHAASRAVSLLGN